MAQEWWRIFGYDDDPDDISSQDYWIPGADDYQYQTPEQHYFGDTTTDYTTLFSGEEHGDPDFRDITANYTTLFSGEEHGDPPDPESQSFLDMYGTTEDEFKALGFGEPGMEAWDIQPEEQSYAEIARLWIAKVAPFLGTANKIGQFAKDFMQPEQRGGREREGHTRQVRSAYTTNRAGSAARTAQQFVSTFKARNASQYLNNIANKNIFVADGKKTVANAASSVGEKISNEELSQMIAQSARPKKEPTPLQMALKQLSIQRRSRSA